jgi:hypothetical protein
MTTDILYYKPSAVRNSCGEDFLGTELLSCFFLLYNAGAVPIDRTNTIQTPIRVKSVFPVPTMRLMTKTFEEICNERAVYILNQSDKHSCDIYVMWSGGIDSTLALISLLKNAKKNHIGRIVAVMSDASIQENPNFFRDHIQGKLRMQTRTVIPFLIGNKSLLVSGEHNDQLFGSDMMAKLISRYGADFIHAPYSRESLSAYYKSAIGGRAADHYLDLFERLVHSAPIHIQSNFEFTWWVNFSLKWQTVYMRMLTFASSRNPDIITDGEYVREYYFPFYNTEDFQLWSLNNLDKRIKDTWKSYKWVCKDIIYEYTKDADYRDNKLKKGSLSSFFRVNDSYKFLDSDFKLHRELDLSKYYNPKNDFFWSKE